MHLEFLYLSYVTGKSVYKNKVIVVRDFLDKIEKKDGLYYNYLNPQSGRWGQGKNSFLIKFKQKNQLSVYRK